MDLKSGYPFWAIRNGLMRAYPRLQDYIAFMLGSPSSGTPTAPFDEESEGWGELEKKLTERFTKF